MQINFFPGDPDVVSDFVPVDILTNAICVATFNYVQLKYDI